MAFAVFWIFQTICLQAAYGKTEIKYSSVDPHGHIMRAASTPASKSSPVEGTQGLLMRSTVTDQQPSVSIFIVTTPDKDHMTMLRNLLCSLFASSKEVASRQEIFVMLHPGQGQEASLLQAADLQQMFRSLGYTRLSVLDAQKIFADHEHWASLNHGFPSNLRVFGIRYVLARMARDSSLLVIDEDVVCSPGRIRRPGGTAQNLNVAEEIARRAPAGAAVTCAHEVPGVVDVFNNGFCLYKASNQTDAFLAAVETRMIKLGFTGDQTPFNQILREDVDIPVVKSSSMSNRASSIAKASDLVASFEGGVVGYLRTWTSEGFPHANMKHLLVVDSTTPDKLMPWSPATPTSILPSSERSGPLCLHYLPFSSETHMWSKLETQC